MNIRALVISPTRELAEQIAVEARKVARGTGVIVQTAVGGTLKRERLRAIMTSGCHLLIGTPGRLKDLLSDPYSGISAPNLSALVLDEADRLLDQGFAPDIEEIQKFLPRRSERDRQTLLFSATVPPEVMSMVRRTMKPDFKFVKTVQAGEPETHERVPQNVIYARRMDNVMPALVELCKREQENTNGPPFKAMVFFRSTAEVALAAATFANLRGPGGSTPFSKNLFYPASIIEIHGRLSQQQRSRASNLFRMSKSGILLTSDVTARGMDFPGVTHVIQVGLPMDKDTYVHRLGRTARGEQQGTGFLLLTEMEKSGAGSILRRMPLTEDASLETARIDMSQEAQLSQSAAEILTQTINALKLAHPDLKNQSYVASFGVYTWAPKQRVVDELNARARYLWGMDTPPTISFRLASKLSYLGVQGLNFGEPQKAGFADRDGRPPPNKPGDRTSRSGPTWTGRGRTGRSSQGFRASEYGDRGSFGDGSYAGRNRRSGESWNDNGAGFGDRDQGGFQGRGRGRYGDRDQGGFRGRDQGRYGARDQDGFRGRDQGRYGDRD